MVGVLAVPHWRQEMDTSSLPKIYRDIVEVVRDAPWPVRAKQVVPRIGLPAEVGKIEGTRGKLKRLVARGWLAESDPGLFTPAPHEAGNGAQLLVREGLFSLESKVPTESTQAEKSPGTEPYDTSVSADLFARSVSAFESLLHTLQGKPSQSWTHAELEEHLEEAGRQLLRQLLQDHLDLRARREEEEAGQKAPSRMIGSDGRMRPWRETGHARWLACMFGLVRVERMAYRGPLMTNVHPADATLSPWAGTRWGCGGSR